MQVTETSSEGLKHEFKVVVAASDITGRVESRLATLQRDARLPGFRPGKVPVTLLRKRFGQQVMGEVLEETVNETSTKAMEEKGLKPAIRPRISVTKFEEGGDLEYDLAVEVLPPVEPGDYSTLELQRLAVEVPESEIDAALTRLVERDRRFKDAEEGRAAAEGDQVVIDFHGKLDGLDFAGGKGTDQSVVVGSGQVLKDLDDSFKGRKAGESYTVDVRFPDDYPAPTVRGKTVAFEVAVKKVMERDEAKADDDFAKRLGVADLAALKDDIRKRMKEDYDRLARMRLKRELLDKLNEKHQFDVPPGMVEMEFAGIWRQVENELRQQRAAEQGQAAGHDHAHDHDHDHAHDHEHDHGHDHAHDHAHDHGHDHAHDHAHDHDHDHGHGHDHDHAHEHGAKADEKPLMEPEEEAKLRAEYRAIAERRVRLGLLLAEVGKRNNIEVSPEELNRAIIARARSFPGQERQVFDYYTKNPGSLQELRAPLFEDKVVDHILGQAKVSDRPATPEEVTRDPDDETKPEGAENK